MQIESIRRAEESPAQTSEPTFRSPVCDDKVGPRPCPDSRERGEGFQPSHEFKQERESSGSEKLLTGLYKNFGLRKGCGRRPLVAKNYAAELTRDCVTLLALLGKKPEQHLRQLDYDTCVTTRGQGRGQPRSILSVNDEARPDLTEAQELVLRIRIRAGDAASRYKNGLPLKAALLLRQTLTAALKDGVI